MAPALRWSWSLRWMYSPIGKEKVFVVMSDCGFLGQFDESGIHDKRGWCVVAGLVGTTKQWERFEKVWGPYGNETAFHGKDFFAHKPGGDRGGEFGGWSDTRSRRYFRALLKAIAEAKLTPISSRLDLTAFWEFSTEDRRIITGNHSPDPKFRLPGAPSKPYHLPFAWVIVRSVRLQEHKNPDLKVNFLFDENRQMAGRAFEVYRLLKKRAEKIDPPFADRMAAIAFGSRRQNLGLQAADLLAYTLSHTLADRHPPHQELREASEVFLRKCTGELTIWDKERMAKLLPPQTPLPRKSEEA